MIMIEKWRFIEDLNQPGSTNMAADYSVLKQFRPGDSPVLRLYTWNRPTLSVGKNQKLGQINLDWCRDSEIPIVRRITGGQAVLHGNDITYSLVGDIKSHLFSGGILQTYQIISTCFFQFFQKLGLSPVLQPHSRRQRSAQASDVCFEVPSAFEILIDGRKIIGNAQRQTSVAFLQHGTIPIGDQVPLLIRVFKNISAETLYSKVTSLETLGVLEHHSLEKIWQLLIDSFQEVFHICLHKQSWSSEEMTAIAKETVVFQPL
ncbi:MAG: lipoate--protein ligase family protein [SAR324 cluster bacterium]|nr:lipoate--protein ligase family protein [SAR324 cluster bacterium]